MYLCPLSGSSSMEITITYHLRSSAHHRRLCDHPKIRKGTKLDRSAAGSSINSCESPLGAATETANAVVLAVPNAHVFSTRSLSPVVSSVFLVVPAARTMSPSVTCRRILEGPRVRLSGRIASGPLSRSERF
jgi:hypothetical protein